MLSNNFHNSIQLTVLMWGIGKTGRGARAGDFLVKLGPGAGRSRTQYSQATVIFALKMVC